METNHLPPFLLNSVDRLGRPIDPAVLSLAQGIASRALSYGEKLVGDPAVALNLFEEAGAAVSEAVENRKMSTQAPIRDLRAYLYQVFKNRIAKERRKQVALGKELKSVDECGRSRLETRGVEMRLVLSEVMAVCDKATQEIALRRLEGFSWEEIGNRYGISSHAARVRFSKALQRARKAFSSDKRNKG